MWRERVVSGIESGLPWVAVLTPRGRGAVASLLLNAPVEWLAGVPFRPVRGGALADLPIDRIAFGHWGEVVREEVVVCRTSERQFEIHCHGGVAAVDRILRDLRDCGASVIDAFDAARRSQGLLPAEVARALAGTRSLAAAQVVVEQRSVWEATLRTWRERWASVRRPEATIVEGTSVLPPEYAEVRRQWRDEISAILRWAEWARHLVEPFLIVVAGPPNAGKSSLVNRLLGYERTIVYHRPGTTRDVVTGETVLHGWPVRLADTAGVRQTEDALEREGIRRARSQAERADLVVWLDDRTQPPVRLSDWADVMARAVLVEHKADQAAHASWQHRPDRGMPVSSKTGAGVDRLVQTLIERLEPIRPGPGQPVPLTPEMVSWLQRLDRALQRGDRETLGVLLQEA